MIVDDAVYLSLDSIQEMPVLYQYEMQDALYMAACIEFYDALERDESRKERLAHCRKILCLGRPVCHPKSTIGTTPMFKDIAHSLKRQADAGEFD